VHRQGTNRTVFVIRISAAIDSWSLREFVIRPVRPLLIAPLTCQRVSVLNHLWVYVIVYVVNNVMFLNSKHKLYFLTSSPVICYLNTAFFGLLMFDLLIQTERLVSKLAFLCVYVIVWYTVVNNVMLGQN